MTFIVYAIPKDSEDDMTEGKGLPIFSGTEEEAEDYAERNDSPDNPVRYKVKEV